MNPDGSWEVGVDKDGGVTFKYVDNTTAFKVVPLAYLTKHFTAGPTTESIQPLGLADTLVTVAKNADEMRVNVKKTQLLWINPNNGCLTSVTMKAGNESVRSSPTMKLVGFTFGTSPTTEAHVYAIREEYRRKVRLFFHLREAGVMGMNLYRLNCCYLRLRIEYLSAAYHSMLVKGHAEALERLHRFLLRLFFGFERDVNKKMGELCIETPSDAFIKRVASNQRFRHWFPLRPETNMTLHNRRQVQEVKSEAHLRRRANELGVAPPDRLTARRVEFQRGAEETREKITIKW